MLPAIVGLALGLGFGRAWAAAPAADFDGVAAVRAGESMLWSLQEAARSMPDVRAVPVYWGADGGWCAPGKPYHGGPCDLHGRRPPQDPDGYHGPQSDPYRNPTGRPPRNPEGGDERGPRQDPRRPPAPVQPQVPDWWDWDRPGRIAADFEFAADQAYAAAQATQRGWWHFRERAAVRDLERLAERAHRFRFEVERGFRARPWDTEQAYRDLLAAYARARDSVDDASLSRPALNNFRRLQDVLDELRRYYEWRSR